jgi:hypothetical protein
MSDEETADQKLARAGIYQLIRHEVLPMCVAERNIGSVYVCLSALAGNDLAIEAIEIAMLGHDCEEIEG